MTKGVRSALPTAELVARTRRLLHREVQPVEAGPADEHRDDPVLDHRIANMGVAMGGLARPPAAVDRRGVTGRAGTTLKRVVRKATAWDTEPRWSAQAYFDEQTMTLAEELAASHQRAARVQVDLSMHLSALTDRVADLGDQVVDLLDQVAAQEQELVVLRTTAPDIDYVAFEERFRGPSTQVKAGQRDYVGRFASSTAGGPVVDIGCGRGEMLELLGEAGIEALGIDLDKGMLADCRARGLDVAHGDAITWLRARPDASLRGIFLAQVVEHLTTLDLVELTRLAAAKISPGGAFVAETIDPRSYYAMANFFWADLSHVRPVHPATLAFLVEQAGFAEVDVLRRDRHELADVGDDVPDGPVKEVLRDLRGQVYGFQDYAVIANR